MQKYSSYCVAKNCQIWKQNISLRFTLMFFRLKLFSEKMTKVGAKPKQIDKYRKSNYL
jgi:hypothetical protein